MREQLERRLLLPLDDGVVVSLLLGEHLLVLVGEGRLLLLARNQLLIGGRLDLFALELESLLALLARDDERVDALLELALHVLLVLAEGLPASRLGSQLALIQVLQLLGCAHVSPLHTLGRLGRLALGRLEEALEPLVPLRRLVQGLLACLALEA